MDAIAGDLPAQRVGGFTLLSRHATQRLESASRGNATESERRDALRLFRGTFDILLNYLAHPNPSSPSEISSQPTDVATAKPGVGEPQLLPRDVLYAAGRLKELVQHKADFLRLRADFLWLREEDRDEPADFLRLTPRSLRLKLKERSEPVPGIDLSNTILAGVGWRDTDFSWLDTRYLPGADLRKAKLTGSNWKPSFGGPTTFKGAFMQCAQLNGSSLEGATLEGAHLEGAKLQRMELPGATLEGADLKDADLQGAHLQGAHLEGAHLEGAHLQGAHLEGTKVKGANFRGATIEIGLLANAKDRDKAIDVNPQPSEALPYDDLRSDLEC